MIERKKILISLLFMIWMMLCLLLFTRKRITEHFLWKEWVEHFPIQQEMVREHWMESLWNMEYSLFPGLAYEARATERMLWMESLWTILRKEILPIQMYLVEYWDGSDGFKKQYADRIPAEFQESDEERVKEEVGEVEITEGNKEGRVYSFAQLADAEFALKHFYTVDESTSMTAGQMDMETYLRRDLSVERFGEEPLILIYHTHGSETYRGGKKGKNSVIHVGETLKTILEEDYRIQTVHDSTVYDMVDGELDRNAAYTYAGKSVEKYIKEHPSIKVVLDLHRDAVPESAHLVTEQKGKKCAQIMFFNGISRDAEGAKREGLPNENLDTNLAMSLQMQLLAAKYFPGFTRRLYVKGYRYNLHLLPRAMLIEAGAQNNTVKEAEHAMEVLAELLYRILSGEKAYSIPKK